MRKIINCILRAYNHVAENEAHENAPAASTNSEPSFSHGIIDSELFNMFIISTLEQQSEIQPALIIGSMRNADSQRQCREDALKQYYEAIQKCNEVTESKQHETCSICLEQFNFKKEIINELWCKHLIHNKCLNSYVYNLVVSNKRIRCPLCRSPFN